MEKFTSENLILIEFLVDRVNFEYNVIQETEMVTGETCVSFQFLDNAPILVCEEDFMPQTRPASGGNVKNGKSCLFSLTPEQGQEALNQFDVYVEVFKKIRSERSDKIFLGESLISIVQMFNELMEEVGTEETTGAKTLKGCFKLNSKNGDLAGNISVYIRMSCYGKLIVTQFQMNLDDKSVEFKAREGHYLFKSNKKDKCPPVCGPTCGNMMQGDNSTPRSSCCVPSCLPPPPCCSPPCPPPPCFPPPSCWAPPRCPPPPCPPPPCPPSPCYPPCPPPPCPPPPCCEPCPPPPCCQPCPPPPCCQPCPPPPCCQPCPPPPCCQPSPPPPPCYQPCPPPPCCQPCPPCPPPPCPIPPCNPPPCPSCYPPPCCYHPPCPKPNTQQLSLSQNTSPCPYADSYDEIEAQMGDSGGLTMRLQGEENQNAGNNTSCYYPPPCPPPECPLCCYSPPPMCPVCCNTQPPCCYPCPPPPSCCYPCPPPCCKPPQALTMRPGCPDFSSSPFNFKLGGCCQGSNNISVSPPTCTAKDGTKFTEISDPDKEMFVLRVGKKSEGYGKKNNVDLELCTPRPIPTKPDPVLDTKRMQYDETDIPTSYLENFYGKDEWRKMRGGKGDSGSKEDKGDKDAAKKAGKKGKK